MNTNVLERKISLRSKRKKRVRGKVFGLSEKPRVTIFRSNKYFYAQAIDDKSGVTLASADGSKLKVGNNREDVKVVAAELAKGLKAKGIDAITFDRNGYLYHGVVASFADTLRENGVKF